MGRGACSRSSSPSARSCRGPSPGSARSRRRRTRTRATGPTGSRCSREGLAAEEVVARLTGADDGARARASSASSTRAAAARRFTGSECKSGPAGAPALATRRRGTSSSRPTTVDALADDVRGDGAAPARRAAARLPRGGAGGGRRPARAAVGRRCSSSSATAATAGSPTSLVDLRVDDHERPVEELARHPRHPHAALRQHAADEWLPLDDELAAEVRERLAAARLRRTLGDWAGVREPRGADRRRPDADRPGRARRAAGG